MPHERGGGVDRAAETWYDDRTTTIPTSSTNFFKEALNRHEVTYIRGTARQTGVKSRFKRRRSEATGSVLPLPKCQLFQHAGSKCTLGDDIRGVLWYLPWSVMGRFWFGL